MKKTLLVSALFAAALSLAAQTGAGGSGAAVSFSTGYVIANYEGVRVENGKTRGELKYTDDISIEDEELFGGLDGGFDINKPHELIAATAVLNIKEVAPADALKVYVEIAMEGAANSFLGVTGTTHSQVLERLRGKYNFTQREITDAIHDTVSEIVKEKLNESRNGYTPAEVYAQWKKLGAGDAQALMIDAITRFYFEPSQTTFRKLVEIYARQYHLSVDGDLFAKTGRDTFNEILLALNSSLREKVGYAGLGLNVEVATLDPRYDVFSTPYGTGGGPEDDAALFREINSGR